MWRAHAGSLARTNGADTNNIVPSRVERGPGIDVDLSGTPPDLVAGSAVDRHTLVVPLATSLLRFVRLKRLPDREVLS